MSQPTFKDGLNRVDTARRFSGISRLYGELGLHRFLNSHVCIIGIGGVGSWAAEALGRSGVGKLTLIDMDHVAESNINRQIQATDTTLGKAKILAMAERLLTINPDLQVVQLDEFISVDNAHDHLVGKFDYIIDCSDNFRVKAEIVYQCRRNKVRLITVGGAGGQVDPASIRVSDLSRTQHDPLLAKVRKQLRTRYGFTRNPARRFDVPCVYSEEQLLFKGVDGDVYRDKSKADLTTGLSCAGGLGSATHVTASFAFHAVSHVLRRLAASTH